MLILMLMLMLMSEFLTLSKKSTPSKFQSSTFFFTLAANFRAFRGISSRYRSPPPFCQDTSDVNHVDHENDVYMIGAVCVSRKSDLPVFKGFCGFSCFWTLLDWCWMKSPSSKVWELYQWKFYLPNDLPRLSHRPGHNIYNIYYIYKKNGKNESLEGWKVWRLKVSSLCAQLHFFILLIINHCTFSIAWWWWGLSI